MFVSYFRPGGREGEDGSVSVDESSHRIRKDQLGGNYERCTVQYNCGEQRDGGQCGTPCD